MALFAAALLLPLLAAYLLIVCCDRDVPAGAATFLFRMGLAVGLGIGVSSGICFLWLLLVGVPGKTYHVAELTAFAAAVAVAAVYRWRSARSGRVMYRGGSAHDLPSERPCDCEAGATRSSARWYRFLQVAALLCLAFALSGVIGTYWKDPLGEYDAWAIWNLHARSMFCGGDQWRLAFFSPVFSFSHPDYPLLVPVGSVRLWSCLGDDCSWTPWLLSGLFTFATVAVLVAGVSRLRDRSQGLLAGITLLGSAAFLRHGAWQQADVPLAYFMLSAVVLWILYDGAERPHGGFLLLSGAMAGMAAWTKNEGLLFLIALPTARIAVAWRPGLTQKLLQEACCWGLGAAPLVAVIAVQKMALAGHSDLLAAQSWAALRERLLDPWRYWCIVQALGDHVIRVGAAWIGVLPLCFLLLGRRNRRSRRPTGLPLVVGVLILMLAGYFLVYVMTPNDLAWHLNSSASRLLLHLWPLCLLCVFLDLATPDELLSS
jgi:hypothetical protein